jgi:hypothetical protein
VEHIGLLRITALRVHEETPVDSRRTDDRRVAAGSVLARARARDRRRRGLEPNVGLSGRAPQGGRRHELAGGLGLHRRRDGRRPARMARRPCVRGRGRGAQRRSDGGARGDAVHRRPDASLVRRPRRLATGRRRGRRRVRRRFGARVTGVIIGTASRAGPIAGNGATLDGGEAGATYCDTFSPELGFWLDARFLDFDGDGVVDDADNCPVAWNQDQANCNVVAEQASIERGVPVAVLGDV